MRQVMDCPGDLSSYFSLPLTSIEAVGVLIIEQLSTTVSLLFHVALNPRRNWSSVDWKGSHRSL